MTEMIEGVVCWFSLPKKYGFCSSDSDGREYFVHLSAITASGLSSLEF